jgi:sporulation protein YlmC with PRC-barrel domain
MASTAIVGALLVVGPAWAQSGQGSQAPARREPVQQQKQQSETKRPGAGQAMPIQDTKGFAQHTGTLRGSQIIGTKVRDRAGKDVGQIEDLIVGADGKVSFAVISFGGILGMGEKLFAVPWNAVSYDPQERVGQVAVRRETLERARGFDRDDYPDTRDQAWTESTRRNWSDASITAAVKSRLGAERAGNLKDVDVDADEGVVKLSGSVPSDEAKRRAAEIVRDVEGVKRVENNIEVKG